MGVSRESASTEGATRPDRSDDLTEANNNNNNSKRPAMIRATSVRTTFAIAIAIASLASVALAQDPCTCKEPCAWVLGANICYVAGGTSCSWATKSMLRWWTNDAWIDCPSGGGATTTSTCDPQYEEVTEKDCWTEYGTETCKTITYPKCVKDCD